MSEHILKDKSYLFALRIIKLYQQIITEHKEYVLSKQLLKAATAIGALVREAEFAQSKADFTSKLSIALKEANEAEYWILLLRDSGYITMVIATNIEADNKEIIRLLVASIKTLKSVKN
jgi:four helix bundle protein